MLQSKTIKTENISATNIYQGHANWDTTLHSIQCIRDVGCIEHTVMKDITNTNVQYSHDLAFFVGYFFMNSVLYIFFHNFKRGGGEYIK